MPDLAFSPDAPEYGPEVAQAPPPELMQSPFQRLPAAAPSPVQAPPAPPTGQGDQLGVQTGTPPPAPTPEQVKQQTAAEAADDMEQQKAADLEEEQQYKTLRSHHGNYDILKDNVTADSHPDTPKLQRALELYSKLGKGDPAIKQYKPLIDGLKAKINTETKAQNDKVNAARKVEAAQADAKYEDVNQRERTYGTIGTIVDTVAGDYGDRAKDRDPKVAQASDFTVKTSPLTTMSIKKRDGTVSYEPLRNAATSIATLNGRMPPDAAVNHVLSMASPLGFDDKGKPLTGVNGKTGAGATTYQVIGRDVRDNYLVVTNDGTHLRVDPDTMAQVRQARQMGWRAAKQWQTDQKKAAEPDWLTRTYRSVIPGKGF